MGFEKFESEKKKMKNKKKNLQHPRKEEYEEGLFSNRFKGFVSSHRELFNTRGPQTSTNEIERRGEERSERSKRERGE